MENRLLNSILKRVEKPGRYVGLEINSVEKKFEEVEARVAFSYPDVYEIGMSYNGMNLLYEVINREKSLLMERVFAPWLDMEKEMRAEKLELFTLESKRPVKDFDFFAFTLQYEMSYTNILNMLNLAGLELRSEDRGEKDPIIIAGGPCAYNPEPMSMFIDAYLLGDGEELFPNFMKLYAECKQKGMTKKEFLQEAVKLEGVYVPSFYKVIYDGDKIVTREKLYKDAPDIINRAYIEDFNSAVTTIKPLIPNVEAVHDRVVCEIFRGCTQGCRFCQAGMVYRPIREKSVGTIIDQIDTMIENSGYDEVSLSSLSSCDYPYLELLVKKLLDKYEDENVSVALPSLRMDSKSLSVLRDIEKVRKTGLTFAPEAGSQRMRDIINKNICDEDIERAINFAFNEGYSTIKLYFMIGLPLEELEDVLAISDVAKKVVKMFFDRNKEDLKGNLKVNVSASCFVPKPFTPFQWVGQDDLETMYSKAKSLKSEIASNKIKFSYHDPKLSRMEGVISRGDRRIGYAIEKAYLMGCKFDGWKDYFKYETWIEAFEAVGLDPDFYANRTRELDEVLPWDFINVGVTKEFLQREWKKANREATTSDCRRTCHACGVNHTYKGEYCPCK